MEIEISNSTIFNSKECRSTIKLLISNLKKTIDEVKTSDDSRSQNTKLLIITLHCFQYLLHLVA